MLFSRIKLPPSPPLGVKKEKLDDNLQVFPQFWFCNTKYLFSPIQRIKPQQQISVHVENILRLKLLCERLIAMYPMFDRHVSNVWSPCIQCLIAMYSMFDRHVSNVWSPCIQCLIAMYPMWAQCEHKSLSLMSFLRWYWMGQSTEQSRDDFKDVRGLEVSYHYSRRNSEAKHFSYSVFYYN